MARFIGLIVEFVCCFTEL
uniref:Uncharacterized protein n=1 Tax=Arundo donax TaxID=35708 RepID=A0A0A8YC40_ARUDO